MLNLLTLICGREIHNNVQWKEGTQVERNKTRYKDILCDDALRCP